MLKDFKDFSSLHVLCYFNGKHHLAMYENIFKLNPDINFCIYSDKISLEEYVKSPIYSLENVYFTRCLDDIIFKINAFICFLTTNAQPTKAHEHSLKIINLCKKSGIKVFELQHGLFQLGLHYYDEPYKEHIHGDSLALSGYADEVLSFYPVDTAKNTVIGYPGYAEKSVFCQGNYVLILSNLHWDTYTDIEKAQFDITISQFIEAHPEKIFIWKPHYGEINRLSNIRKNILSNRKNVIFATGENILEFISTDDLIKNADYVISSVSTVLLDCEKHSKPTFIYRAESTKVLLDKIEDKNEFSNFAELEQEIFNKKVLKTGKLVKFKNDVFRKCIFDIESHIDNNALLNNIIESYHMKS